MEVVKYGYVYGVRSMIPVVVGGSEHWKDMSGCFVKFETTVDVNGRPQVVPAGDSDANLAGWVDISEYTSGTDGLDEWMMDISFLSVYRIGVDVGTLGLDDVGDFCDLKITSYIQGIQANAGIEGTLIIVQRESSSVALVRMNPTKMTGLAAAAD